MSSVNKPRLPSVTEGGVVSGSNDQYRQEKSMSHLSNLIRGKYSVGEFLGKSVDYIKGVVGQEAYDHTVDNAKDEIETVKAKIKFAIKDYLEGRFGDKLGGVADTIADTVVSTLAAVVEAAVRGIELTKKTQQNEGQTPG